MKGLVRVASVCRAEVKVGSSLLHIPVKVTCADKAIDVPLALLDTGATMCHMTYPMWLRMKLDEICWKANPHAFQCNGISSASDITFENLPLVADSVTLGNNTLAQIYDFRIDKLELGESPHAILLENITVSLIDGDAPGFTVGWNVLKYLKTSYTPALPFDINKASSNEIVPNYYHIELTDVGKVLLEYDRHLHFSNYMQSMFEYNQVTRQ